jgi:hypothetical protein
MHIGIRRGIAIISAQLEAATARMTDLTPNPTVQMSSVMNLKHAESSLRSGPTDSPSASTNYWTSPPKPFGEPGVDQTSSSLPSEMHSQMQIGLSPSILNGSSTDNTFSTFFDDASNQKYLADLLGESNVDTNDPFAFLTSEGWEDMTY